MLTHLFNNDIRVFASKGKAEVASLDFNSLQEVTDLDYGRGDREVAGVVIERAARKETRMKRRFSRHSQQVQCYSSVRK